MLALVTRVYVRIHYSTFVFLSFTSFTIVGISLKITPSGEGFLFF